MWNEDAGYELEMKKRLLRLRILTLGCQFKFSSTVTPSTDFLTYIEIEMGLFQDLCHNDGGHNSNENEVKMPSWKTCLKS